MNVDFAVTRLADDLTLALPFSPDRDDGYTRGVASGGWPLEESCTFIRRYFRHEVASTARTFIDVGANCGIYTLVVGALGVPVLAIEALPDNYLLLAAGIRRNGFRNIRPMLAAATSEMTLVHIDGTSAWGRVAEQGVPVPGLTLDDMLAMSDLPAPALVKIDVEGHELQVLQGAVETIERHADLDFVIEIFPGHEQSLRFLEARGYHCHMLKQDGLIPTRSDDFFEHHVTDFFCTKRVLDGERFADTPILTRDAALSVAMLTLEAREPAVAHRIAIAARLQHAPPHLRDDPAVQRLMDELQVDPDPQVRAAIGGWRTKR